MRGFLRQVGVGLIALTLAASTLVVDSPGPAGPAPVAASTCSGEPFPTNLHTGTDNSSPTINRYGVSAYIDPAATYFRPCTSVLGNDGPSAWVALVPRSTAFGDSAIVQLGIINCNYYWNSACAYPTPHYIWAQGGCNGAQPTPRDLGPADFGQHHYSIALSSSGNGRIYLWIDGVLKLYTSLGNGEISCWASGLRKAAWFGERLDYGDDFSGDAAEQAPLWFRDARLQTVLGGSPVTPGWSPSSPCVMEPEWPAYGWSSCAFSNGDEIRMWTDPLH
jgi:hypothetical protein